MTLRLARTNDEAYLYIGGVPCEECGHVGVGDIVPSLFGERDGHRFRTFVTDCPECGTRREFAFRVPRVSDPPSPLGVRFGGSTPSELMDPGEWLVLADNIIASVPDDLSVLTDAEREQLRDEVDVARAAIEEVLKFIPPGRDAVPSVAFWTKTGRQKLMLSRRRFDRDELTGNLRDCIALHAELRPDDS